MIEQVGTPCSLYDRLASLFVYQFLGNVNRLRLRVTRGSRGWHQPNPVSGVKELMAASINAPTTFEMCPTFPKRFEGDDGR